MQYLWLRTGTDEEVAPGGQRSAARAWLFHPQAQAEKGAGPHMLPMDVNSNPGVSFFALQNTKRNAFAMESSFKMAELLLSTDFRIGCN